MGTVMVQCGICSFKSTSGEFGQHMGANHRAEMELEAVQHPKCNQCDFTAPTSNKLSQHMKSVHEQFKCDLCDTEEVFVTKRSWASTTCITTKTGRSIVSWSVGFQPS